MGSTERRREGKTPISELRGQDQHSRIMKVLLQDTQTKLYYAGPGRWVKERGEALDLEKIERAAQAYDTENYPFAEILVEDNGTNLHLPVTHSAPAVAQAK